MQLRDLPAPARTLATTISKAVDAAAREDAEELRSAAAALSGLDGDLTGTLLGGILRTLLEEQHPDGLDADDFKAALTDSTLAVSAWLPEADPHTLLILLAGAMGIHPDDHDEVLRPPADALALHAPALTAHLLRGRPFEPRLTAAFLELARSQTMDTD